jgi:starch-binding outer membrane protein, SusD/RagB family
MIFILVFLFASCKKWVQVPPPSTSTASNNVYGADATAIAVLTGIYTQMSNTSLSGGGITSMSLFPGLSADEISVFGNGSQSVTECYTNSLVASNLGSVDFWSEIYPIVYDANAAIAGLSSSNLLTSSIKQQLLGEATFIRALCYFYLVNLYGDVPLVTGTDYKTNSVLPRSSSSIIYQQVIADCIVAQSELNSNYLDGTLLNITDQRVRPTSWAATALLARTYLYLGKWDSAINESTSIINNSTLYTLDSLNGVFLANGPEDIWQLQPVVVGENTQDAWLFIIPPGGPDPNIHPFYLNEQLINSFENGDMRRTNWVDSVIASGVTYYFPYKYKSATANAPVTEYEVILRLGEQFLIRAEAEAEMGDLTDATTDLNVIRSRANLPGTSAITQTALLHAILHERQVELFTEWGHRWFDLKRTDAVDSVMTIVNPLKGGNGWTPNAQWYPISTYELENDPNLKQNSGY